MGETRAKRSKRVAKGSDKILKQTNIRLRQLSLRSDAQSMPGSETEESESNASFHQASYKGIEDGKDGNDLRYDPNLIEIRQAQTKGQAVFTTRKISAGTLILAETPLTRLTQNDEDLDTADSSASPEPAALLSQYNSLPRQLQKSYLALHDSQKSTFSRLKSIYYSNCYNLSGANRPSKTSPGGSCIGLLASRINHSCVPNVQFSFDESRNLMLFHAIKPIPKNREVLSLYDPVYEVKAQRQKRMQMYYGFRCDCEACEPRGKEFWEKSDGRRMAMIHAKREAKACERFWGENGRLDDGTDPVHVLERLEKLLTKEGIVGLPRADVCKALVRWTERLGKPKAMRKWMEREMEVCIVCLGQRNIRVVELRERLEKLEVDKCSPC